MTTDTQTGPLTYGNWQKPRTPGLVPRLGVVGSGIALLGFVLVALTTQARGLVVGGVALLGLAVALGPVLYRNPAGRNGWQVAGAQLAWKAGKARGRHLYTAGRVPTADGTVPVAAFGAGRLPGLLAPSKLLETVDQHGARVGLVHVPAARHYTVLLQLDPEGDALVDESTVDTWVGRYGQWLADLGHEPELVAASVTVETSPDPGHRLAVEVDRQLVDGCPPLAAEVLRACAATYPSASAEVGARVALTFSARRVDRQERELGGRRAKRDRTRTPEDMAGLITSRLPGLVRGLADTGAGSVRPMTAGEISTAVRLAYDPGVADELDAWRAAAADPRLTWDQAGPVGAVEGWSTYRHDGAASITWQMSQAPRGQVGSRVLAQLLAPSQQVGRKRVTVVYRPHPAGDAATITDRDVRTAIGRATGRPGEARAGETVALAAARQSAAEEATGAGLVRFSLLVTATASPEQLGDVAEHVDQLGRACRLRLRRAYGSQAASFSAGLGVGLVLPSHVTMIGAAS